MAEKTLLSMSEAADMVGLTRPTFYRKVEELGISLNEDSGKKKVDVSELIRVFGNDFKLQKEPMSKMSAGPSMDKNISTNQLDPTDNNSESLSIKVAVLEAELKKEKELRNEIKEEIDYFKEQIALEKEEKKKITLLLEDHSSKEKESRGGDEWQKMMKALEQRIANQEKAVKEQRDREQRILRQNQALKKALEAEKEKSKSFFQKLFG